MSDEPTMRPQFPTIRESRNTTNRLPPPGWYIETGFGSFYVMRVGEDGSGTIYHTLQAGLEDWAAAALTEAQATIALQQVMLDRALEASFDDKARADRMEAALRALVHAVRAWRPSNRGGLLLAAAMRDADAALTDKPDAGEGE